MLKIDIFLSWNLDSICKQYRLQSEGSFWSLLIWVYTVCKWRINNVMLSFIPSLKSLNCISDRSVNSIQNLRLPVLLQSFYQNGRTRHGFHKSTGVEILLELKVSTLDISSYLTATALKPCLSVKQPMFHKHTQ